MEEMEPNKFGTLVEAEANLRLRGFDSNFSVDEKGLHVSGEERYFKPDEVTIVEHHRFEGASAPEDMAVLYAIDAQGVMGILIDAYGTYSEQHVGDFLRKVEDIKQQGDQDG